MNVSSRKEPAEPVERVFSIGYGPGRAIKRNVLALSLGIFRRPRWRWYKVGFRDIGGFRGLHAEQRLPGHDLDGATYQFGLFVLCACW